MAKNDYSKLFHIADRLSNSADGVVQEANRVHSLTDSNGVPLNTILPTY